MGVAAGWLCGLLPHVGRKAYAAYKDRQTVSPGLWKPMPRTRRTAWRSPPRTNEALPRHMADVRMGMFRRGI